MSWNVAFQDDDWCELCGSEGCEGECQDEPVGELPEVRLARLANEERERQNRAVNQLVEDRFKLPALSRPPPSKKRLEARLARRPKRVVVRLADGTTYRKKS